MYMGSVELINRNWVMRAWSMDWSKGKSKPESPIEKMVKSMVSGFDFPLNQSNHMGIEWDIMGI